jgi:hypothetical protein
MADIFVRGTRILTPAELDLFLQNIPKDHHVTIFEVHFWTGMRYEELRRFWAHPEWYMQENRAVHLPKGEGERKGKGKGRELQRQAPDRYIFPLPPTFAPLLRRFHTGPKPPTRQTWDENIHRWAVYSGLSPTGFGVKSARKSIESWLITAGVRETLVCLRQGHTRNTSMVYYQGLPFTPPDREKILQRLSWVDRGSLEKLLEMNKEYLI